MPQNAKCSGQDRVKKRVPWGLMSQEGGSALWCAEPPGLLVVTRVQKPEQFSPISRAAALLEPRRPERLPRNIATHPRLDRGETAGGLRAPGHHQGRAPEPQETHLHLRAARAPNGGRGGE